MGKNAKAVNKIHFTMLYGNYCYIFIENFPQKFSPCRLAQNKEGLDYNMLVTWFLRGDLLASEHCLEDYKCERHKTEVISKIILDNGLTDPILKNRVAKISRLCVPLSLSLLIMSVSSPEK